MVLQNHICGQKLQCEDFCSISQTNCSARTFYQLDQLDQLAQLDPPSQPGHAPQFRGGCLRPPNRIIISVAVVVAVLEVLVVIAVVVVVVYVTVVGVVIVAVVVVAVVAVVVVGVVVVAFFVVVVVVAALSSSPR